MYCCAGMFEDEAIDRGVAKAFTCFMDWYMRTRAVVQTEATIGTMDRAGVELLVSLKVFRPVTGSLTNVFNRLLSYIHAYIGLYAVIIIVAENHH